MAEAPADLRTLRKRRERANDWITYASWTAIGTAGLAGLAYFTVWLSSIEGPFDVASVVSTLVAQGLFGYKLRTSRSQLAAYGLMGAYILGLAVGVMTGTIWSGLLVKLAVAYVYVRGFIATLDYEELTKQIRAATEIAPVNDAT